MSNYTELWMATGVAVPTVSVLLYVVKSVVKPMIGMMDHQGRIVEAYVAEAKERSDLLAAVAQNLGAVTESLATLHADHGKMMANQGNFLGILSAEVCQVPGCPLRNQTSEMAWKLRKAAAEKILEMNGGEHVDSPTEQKGKERCTRH